jgi:hypothetical protein
MTWCANRTAMSDERTAFADASLGSSALRFTYQRRAAGGRLGCGGPAEGLLRTQGVEAGARRGAFLAGSLCRGLRPLQASFPMPTGPPIFFLGIFSCSPTHGRSLTTPEYAPYRLATAGSDPQGDFLQIYTLGKPAPPGNDYPARRDGCGVSRMRSGWRRRPETIGVLP